MMAINRGKKFEQLIKQQFLEIPNVSVDRVHDQTTGYKGSSNICDFVVYKKPTLYYIECKTVHGNILPFSNITERQWTGLLTKTKIPGVIAGVLCWWVDKGVTRFIPIQVLEYWKQYGHKSLRYDESTPCECHHKIIDIPGKKKRVFYEYNLRYLLDARISVGF